MIYLPNFTFHNQEAKAVDRLFNSVRPDGWTYIGKRLNKLLEDYINKLDSAMKKQGRKDVIKPINYIVLTDGEASTCGILPCHPYVTHKFIFSVLRVQPTIQPLSLPTLASGSTRATTFSPRYVIEASTSTSMFRSLDLNLTSFCAGWHPVRADWR